MVTTHMEGKLGGPGSVYRMTVDTKSPDCRTAVEA